MIGAYRVADARRVFPPVPPETVTLGTYTFLAHHRTGIAAALTTAFSTAAPVRGEVHLAVPVVAADGDRADAPVTLRVRGPADVLNLDPRQIVRRFPEPGTATAEPNDLVHVELDTPDLPWQFTPTGPDGGRLPPWLRLVVAPASAVTVRPPARPGLPDIASVPLVELPPADDAWAWAHVQVMGPKASPGLAERLAPSSPELNVARLLCPRRLTHNVDWVALVVPTFDAGRLAGLGLDVPDGATLTYAWGPGSPDIVDLPAYDRWQFGTGPDGDFEALAKRLLPVRPPEGVGRRRVDTGHPGNGIARQPDDDPGADRSVFGPLVRVGDPSSDGRSWPPATELVLQDQVNAPARQRFGAPDADPTVAPPLYAGTHLARGEVGEADDPEWFHSLNLDPADRVVAGLGTRVVQLDQEDLMVSAWAQVAGVEAANAALRAAQLGRWAGASMHRRHLATLPAADLLAVTARGHARVLHAPERTVLAEVDASALPLAAAGAVLRRLARPAGPLARFTRSAEGAEADDRRARLGAVRRLLADTEDRATDWVVAPAVPDGISDVSELTLALLPDEVSRPLAAVRESLASGGILTLMTKGGQQGDWARRLLDADRDGVDRTATGMLRALTETLPTPEELRADQADIPVALAQVAQIRAVVRFGASVNVGQWGLSRRVCERFGIAGDRADDDPGGDLVVGSDVPLGVAAKVAETCTELADANDPGVDDRVLGLLSSMREVPQGGLAEDLVRISADLAVSGVADAARATVAVADLDLLTRLDPALTATRRIRARISTWPTWLLPDWFDDTRIDPVMVAPAFHHPMYEALNRYDPEWLLPGVAAMTPQEMTTLLQTNSRFVEAFLVGLNHEFARELLWREYPTDGRATSFRSFWTTRDELLAPVHQLGAGALGAHVDPDLSDAIVLLVRGELVRRYPDVLAHAVQQTTIAPPPPVYRDDPDPVFAASTPDILFRLHLPPDLLLVGFKLKSSEVMQPRDAVPAWWFTLSEHVGQPRFGLDVLDVAHPDTGHSPGSSVHRDDLAWGDLATVSGFLTTGAPHVTITDVSTRTDAAAYAERLFQLPARAAFLAADMIAGMS